MAHLTFSSISDIDAASFKLQRAASEMSVDTCVIAFSTTAVNLYTLVINGSNSSRMELRVFVRASCRMLGTENNYHHNRWRKKHNYSEIVKFKALASQLD